MSAHRHDDADDAFSYTQARDGKVLVYFNDRHVATLSGGDAERLLAKLENADERHEQKLLAQVSRGHKRGGDKPSKSKSHRGEREDRDD